ncbi:MAG: hypothetical protein KGH89_02115 [Thaumarchaeota archaeon]|nr:hypothetical protein [Nitrososphaerota archaeon]MDE1866345.1 hypothetical protein [Nitrososphaerota archaeon]
MKRKSIGIAIGATAAVIAVIFFLVMPNQTQTQTQVVPNPKLGLVIMPLTARPTFNEIHNAYIQAASTGIGRSNVYMLWPIVESQKGTFNWQTYDILMGLNREQHLNATLYFSIINNDQLGPFPSWLGQPNIDDKLANETASALDTILSRYYIVDYVIIGGDMDIYFRDHPNDIPKYVDFFNSVYSQLKAKHPNVKFGNWFSLNDLINHHDGDMVAKLNQGDFVAYSYAPVDLLFYQTNSPDREVQDLQNMMNFSGGKNIALMEIGWSTSKSINGTTEDQTKFVKSAFDFYRKNESQFEFMTWYRQYDRPFDTCYSSLNTNIQTGFNSDILANNTAAYLCSTGLIDDNNNTKPAWDEFKNQIQMSPNS